MKIDLFKSYGHCWVFQTCWHISCNTLIASSFRIFKQLSWNSITSTSFISSSTSLSPFTSQSRISASGWVTTPSWLSGSLKSFLYSFFVYSCHLFLISYASIISLSFLSFIVPVFAWNVSLIAPIFLKRSLVFPLLLFSSISLHCSLKKAFLSLLAILWNSAFSSGYLSLSPLLLASLLFYL